MNIRDYESAIYEKNDIINEQAEIIREQKAFIYELLDKLENKKNRFNLSKLFSFMF